MVAFILANSNQEIIQQPVPHKNEEDLIIGLKSHNKQAIDHLYKMYAGSLYGIIKRIVKFDEIAEDTLQDTFVKIWKSIEKYDASKGRLFTWMANLAKNVAIDQVRNKNYVKQGKTVDIAEVANGAMDQHSTTIFKPETIGIKQLIAELTPDQQSVLNLIYFNGYTHVEVAETLGIPLGTVKTRLRLSIVALRGYFNDDVTLKV